MIGKLVLVLIAIALLIAGPVVAIWIVNFLLCQMFASYIPLEINIYNWVAVFGLEMLIVGSSKTPSN